MRSGRMTRSSPHEWDGEGGTCQSMEVRLQVVRILLE